MNVQEYKIAQLYMTAKTTRLEVSRILMTCTRRAVGQHAAPDVTHAPPSHSNERAREHTAQCASRMTLVCLPHAQAEKRDGATIEVLKNEACSHPEHGVGQYTLKHYHFHCKLPGWWVE